MTLATTAHIAMIVLALAEVTMTFTKPASRPYRFVFATQRVSLVAMLSLLAATYFGGV